MIPSNSTEDPNGSPSTTRIIVFIGPSFPPDRVAEFLPSAEIRRPIQRDDLESIDPPAIVAIIDGVFDSELAVSPREIRTAIARGVKIMGASSMGALRAAEIPEMLGVGRIYEMYRDGTLERDDEVAVLLDADTSRCLTEPLVNVRFAVQTLTRSGSLDGEQGQAIVDAAARLHFHDRVYRNILREAGFVAGTEMDVLVAALRSINLKQDDAQTLLETLPRLATLPHWQKVTTTTTERRHEYVDHFTSAHIRDAGLAEDAVLVWEYGESIPFKELVGFLAATGRLERHLRETLLHFAMEGDIRAPLEPGADVPTVQELFDDVMAEWGWGAGEEVHVTLNDVGVGSSELQRCLWTERRRRGACIRAVRSMDDHFLRALRAELTHRDLVLKRETMRLGALRGLAARAPTDPGTDDEMDDAWRAILCERPEMTCEGLLAESGIGADATRPVLEMILRARRVGVPLLETMDRSAGPGRPPAAGAGFPEVVRRGSATGRSMEDGEAVEIARRIANVIGITRIAQVGELERFGLHVTSVYRPSTWSSSIGSGKSESPEGAVVGGVMEEVEKYCQEHFRPDAVVTASLEKARAGGKASVIDPREFALPYDSNYTDGDAVAWSWAKDIVTGEDILVPRAVLAWDRGANDVLFSPRAGRKIFSSNGLASGMTFPEALLHALCERIERHANKLSEQDISNPGQLPESRWPSMEFIDLASCPASTQRIVEGIHKADYQVRVLDTTCEVKVPTFAVRMVRPRRPHGLDAEYCVGSCTHPNPEVAINRALLEAVQTRIGRVSGGREDMGLRARSLGRHERPRPISRGDAYWIRPYVPKKPFAQISGHGTMSVTEDLAFVVERVTAAGFDSVLWADLTRPEAAEAKVVRVLVPGMEDTNPFHTGLRGRARIVGDLLHNHAW